MTRPSLAHFISDPGEFEWRTGALVAAIANGSVTVRVGARYALADAAQAHRDLESRATTGSIALMA